MLPPNVIPLMELMVQNVIRLLAMVVANKLSDINVVTKQYTLSGPILNLSRVWKKPEPPIIKKCWKNILPSQYGNDPVNNIPLATFRQELLKLNSILETNVNLLNEQNAASMNEWNKNYFDKHYESCTAIDYSDDSEIECVTDQNEGLPKDTDKINHVEVIRVFNRGLKWTGQNTLDAAFIESIQSLQKLQTVALLCNHLHVPLKRRIVNRPDLLSKTIGITRYPTKTPTVTCKAKSPRPRYPPVRYCFHYIPIPTNSENVGDTLFLSDSAALTHVYLEYLPEVKFRMEG
ncbi:hypothetical protein Trydic_g1200 [Trypoxylus dichotomus]